MLGDWSDPLCCLIHHLRVHQEVSPDLCGPSQQLLSCTHFAWHEGKWCNVSQARGSFWCFDGSQVRGTTLPHTSPMDIIGSSSGPILACPVIEELSPFLPVHWKMCEVLSSQQNFDALVRNWEDPAPPPTSLGDTPKGPSGTIWTLPSDS